MTDTPTTPLAQVPVSDRGAALLNAGMTAAASPLAIKSHGEMVRLFRRFSKAVWAVPIVVLIWGLAEGQFIAGALAAACTIPFVAFFAFVARRVSAGNQVLQDELRKAGL